MTGESEGRTSWLLCKEIAGVVIVDNSYCQTPSCSAAFPAPRFLGGWRGGDEAFWWKGAGSWEDSAQEGPRELFDHLVGYVKKL